MDGESGILNPKVQSRNEKRPVARRHGNHRLRPADKENPLLGISSDGGFGENIWIRDGNRWLVKATATLADGSEISSTNVLTPVDANTFTLESKDRTDNGEHRADLPQITLKRQLPAKDEGKANTSEEPPRRVLP